MDVGKASTVNAPTTRMSRQMREDVGLVSRKEDVIPQQSDFERTTADLIQLAAKIESDDALAAADVDWEALKALQAALKRCTLAADGLAAEKALSSLSIAEKPMPRAPLQAITNRADVPSAGASGKTVAFKLNKPRGNKERRMPTQNGNGTKKQLQPPQQPTKPPPLHVAPRMPRLLVVIDTNEILLDRSVGQELDRDFLLQDCGGCDIILPAQVAAELDGLKRSSDAALAACARRANALLSSAAQAREPWLLCEPLKESANDCAASELCADEKVLRCATKFASRVKGHPSDRIVLATSDRNLLLRAASEGVEAMPLAQAREHAQARHDAWRAAYGTVTHAQDVAANAIAAATWARTYACAGRAEEGLVEYGPHWPALHPIDI
jgi:rRNA-processing protein FCF1